MGLRLTAARYADEDDLPRVSSLAARLGLPGPDGSAGTVVVVGEPAVGFAHLTRLDDGRLHLASLAAEPTSWPGTDPPATLLGAACGLAWDEGQRWLTASVAGTAGQRDALERWGFTGDPPRRPLADEPPPVPAVSVIPVRDGPAGLEAFVQHRVHTMDFAAGAVVFPGGRVDPQDRVTATGLRVGERLVAAWRRTPFVARDPDPEQAVRTLLATGVREVAEETGAPVAADDLLPWDSWVTPAGWPRRFDVHFFVLPVAGEDVAAGFGHTTTEATVSEWLPLARVVDGAEAGRLALLPPTRALVSELADLGSVTAVVALRPEVVPVRHDLMPGRRPRPPGSASQRT